MNKTKFFISLILAVSLLVGQVGIVFAAPVLQKSTPLTGTIQSITLEIDSNTGITIIIIEVINNSQAPQKVRISQETALTIGIVTLDGDGNPVINNLALGQSLEIDPAEVIPDQQPDRHPVGNALATFFSDIVDYDTVMAAHEKGMGFGVIAQALWLTKQLGGDQQVFQSLLGAKETGDYSAFTFSDGTTPKNWGQLRKAILDGKKLNKVASNPNHGNANGNRNNDGKGNGKGNENGSGAGNSGNDGSNGNGNGSSKENHGNGNRNGKGNGNESNKDK